jgi:hypothetical protein
VERKTNDTDLIKNCIQESKKHITLVSFFIKLIFSVSKERMELSSHGYMARGGHGLPKVSLGPAMSYLSTLPKQLYGMASNLQPSTLLDTPRRTPMELVQRLKERSNI